MKALTPTPGFDFIHNMQSGTLFFQFGSEAVFVVLYDLGIGAHSNIAEQFEYHRGFIASQPTDEQQEKGFLAQRVWACESAYFLFRALRGFSFVKSDGSFHGVPSLGRPSARPSDPIELAHFSRSFGLQLEKFGEGGVGHLYKLLVPGNNKDLP
ncbi:hypothetical protein A9K66_27710 [Mesorhizobium sp. AA23]|nr:hypothetical protein A9K66_27710 [Mesorhizobium sp. AA23]